MNLKRTFPAAPVALCLFAIYCFAWLLLPPCFNKHSFLASIIDKHAALDRAPSPKIVFVGGSNLAFGLDSAAVEAGTGMPVVNMGVTRLLGLRYCLEEIKDSVHQGDMIVIVPEYENFYGEMNGSSHLMNVPLLMPRAIPWVWATYATSPQRICALADDIRGVMSYKWGWWRERIVGARRRQALADFAYLGAAALFNPGESRGNSREKFTKAGDYVGHLDEPPPQLKYMKLCESPHDFDPESITVLNQFNAFATARGAQVVMLPPPLPKVVYLHNQQKLNDVYEYCKTNLQFSVLSSPHEYVFANRDFYNSLYHLTRKSREERTERLVRDLQVHTQTAARTKTGTVRL